MPINKQNHGKKRFNRDPIGSGLTFKHWLALRNSPTRPGLAIRQRYIRETKEAVLSKTSTNPDLRRSINLLLETSYAQGMHDGLRDAWRLHDWALKQEFSLEKKMGERWRYVVPYTYRHPDATDEQICKYLDGEIERLYGKRGQPWPPEDWKPFSESSNPWLSVLRNAKSRQRVCSYMNRTRKIARSNAYALLEAWRDVAHA